MMHGEGVFTWPLSGGHVKVYKGQYRDDKKHGYGEMSWSEDGRKYAGQWANGKQHGHGTYVSSGGGEPISGEWNMGKRVK
jgi:hypothetical protein